jgi:hypothetical protein
LVFVEEGLKEGIGLGAFVTKMSPVGAFDFVFLFVGRKLCVGLLLGLLEGKYNNSSTGDLDGESSMVGIMLAPGLLVGLLVLVGPFEGKVLQL